MEIVFAGPDKRSDKKEILDDFDCDIPTLKENLKDIATFNSLLKTRDAILAYIKMIIEVKALKGKIKILDLCAGSADIAVHIIDWARNNDKNIEVTAIDIGEDIITVAKEETKDYPEIICQTGDAFNLPFENESFDIVICSQAFHHFSDDSCIKLLKIMYKLCSSGLIVNDLRRAWLNYAGAFIISRVFKMHYMSKNDAPLSVLRAFKKQDLINFSEIAGIKKSHCYSYFTHSLQLVSLK